MQIDYQYTFSDFTDCYADVEIVNYRNNNRAYTIAVRVQDTNLIKTHRGALNSVWADLADLAMAVFTSDWLLTRSLDESRNILIELPLRNPELFRQHQGQLQSVLRWYTQDNWRFKFSARQANARTAERQPKLSFNNSQREVALWSGGLDAYAGLCHRIKNTNNSEYTLVGLGSNTQVLGKQAQIFEEISRTTGQHNALRLLRIPLQFDYKGQSKPPQNKLFRARGFVFKLCGAICALMEGVPALHIYENGFGAFNLPFTNADIALAHTRSVHPTSLIKTGEFVSIVVGQSFRFVNPFLFMTKAEMCRSSLDFPQAAMHTETCDGPLRETAKQCGICSSCLLRRLSLKVVFGKDETKYAKAEQTSKRMNHFRAMDIQVERINTILNADDPWLEWISEYPDFRMWTSQIAADYGFSKEETKRRILHLYRTHSREWMHLRTQLQPKQPTV